MSIGQADIAKAVVSVWNNNGLNAVFKSHWLAANRSEFAVLCDGEGESGHPFPYCVFGIGGGKTQSRMTGRASTTTHQELRDIPLQFKVYARETGGNRSPKELASDLAEEIMKIFGGHPTVAPKLDDFALDNGAILINQYQMDFSVREDEQIWGWVIKYIIKSDVPVRIG